MKIGEKNIENIIFICNESPYVSNIQKADIEK